MGLILEVCVFRKKGPKVWDFSLILHLAIVSCISKVMKGNGDLKRRNRDFRKGSCIIVSLISTYTKAKG